MAHLELPSSLIGVIQSLTLNSFNHRSLDVFNWLANRNGRLSTVLLFFCQNMEKHQVAENSESNMTPAGG